MEMREQRREQRYPLDCLATLTWGDHQGQSRSLQAKALDISDYVITTVGEEFRESHVQSSRILHRLPQAPRSKPAGREREQELALTI